MGNKVLVVGATGLVGSEVVKALLERGVHVKAASRKGAELPGAEATIFDFDRRATVESALAEVDRVFLLTPSQSLTEAEEVVPPLVQRLGTAGVRKIVCMTGISADRAGAPMNEIEASVKESGIAYTLLRPNWFNQNFAPGFYLESINRAGGLFLPVADAKTSFVDTRDIGAVAAVALTEDGHDGREYTLTGPEALDHSEVCAILSEAAGREIPYTPISDDDLRNSLRRTGLPDKAIEPMVRLYQITREGICAVVSDDVGSVLGRPPITFAQYAKDYAEFLKLSPVGGE
jgi:uncharacterized protein YbjT (DUF2867 family)